MEHAILQIDQEQLPEGLIWRLRGDVTAEAKEILISSLMNVDTLVIVMDFGEVAYINSAGIASLIAMLRQTRAAEASVRVIGLSDHYRKIFRMVGLTEYLQIL